jgi:hypothetical protein
VTKKGLQKKLTQRAEANAARFDKLDEQIDGEVAKINFAQLQCTLASCSGCS